MPWFPLLATALSMTSACATASPSLEASPPPALPSSSATDKASLSHLTDDTGAADSIKIQALFDSSQHSALLESVQRFEQKYPKSRHRVSLSNLKGLSLLALGRHAEAQSAFQYALVESDRLGTKEYQDFRPFYLYNLAASQEQAANLSAAFDTLSQIQVNRLNLHNRTKYHGMKARIHRQRKDFVSASEEWIKISQFVPEDGPNAQTLWLRPLEQSAKQIDVLSDLERLSQQAEGTPAEAVLLWTLGLREEKENRRSQALARFQKIVEDHPTSAFRPLAAQRMDVHSSSGPEATPYAIGALLPLTGKFARYGQKALQGLQLSLEIFTPQGPSGKNLGLKSPFTLFVEDSGETPEQALQAFDRLTQTHKVLAVVGPLLSKGIEAITESAIERQIPLLTLSQQAGNEGSSVFSLGLTPQSQAREIAHYSIRQLGLKRFAILHPQDKFGEQYAQAFWDAVEELGGEIRGIESYPPGETDYRTQVDRLSGLFYGEARSRELKALSEQRTDQHIKKRNRRTEKFYSLPPIVDYDAVFIPDEPKAIGMAVPTFSYRDVDGIKFLGTATWNTQDIGGRLQALGPFSYFPDAFHLGSTAPEIQKFVTDYRATFNQDPSAMDAIAFDAGKILKNLITSGPKDLASKPKALQDALAALPEYSGVSGKISNNPSHPQWKRMLRTLTLKSGQIIDAP